MVITYENIYHTEFNHFNIVERKVVRHNRGFPACANSAFLPFLKYNKSFKYVFCLRFCKFAASCLWNNNKHARFIACIAGVTPSIVDLILEKTVFLFALFWGACCCGSSHKFDLWTSFFIVMTFFTPTCLVLALCYASYCL